MGAVYAGTHVQMRRAVAVKLLRPEVATDETARKRFEREARAASQIVNPHIVTLFDYGETDDGLLYIVMERLEGETVSERIERTGPLSIAQAVSVGLQVARALVAAHEAGVVHRDLKPENIFLTTPNDDVKVLDFGIAKVVGEEAVTPRETGPVTVAGTLIGTPLYMSPEAAARKGRVGKPADLYALGLVIFEMIVGRTVFEEDEPVLLLGMHLRMMPERISEAAPSLPVPAELDDLVDALLAKNPAERPTAKDVVTALAEIASMPLRERPLGQLTPEPPLPSLARSAATLDIPPAPISRKTKPKYTVAIGVVVMLALGVVALFAFDGAREPAQPAPIRQTAAAPVEEESPAPEVAEPTPAPPPEGPARLLLEVRPEGAEVLLDGDPIGTAPLTSAIELTPGVHVLEARRGRDRAQLHVEAHPDREIRRVLVLPNAEPEPPRKGVRTRRAPPPSGGLNPLRDYE